VYLAILALSVTLHHHSRWLVADGTISRALVADPDAWIAKREAFIRTWAAKREGAALPVVYKLDADFVTAAKSRGSIEVVDDCGSALCGVATDELSDDWDIADLRAMYTPPSEPRLQRDAKAAAIGGRWMGESVEAIAADLRAAGITSSDDPLIAVPLWSDGRPRPSKEKRQARTPVAPLKGATVSVVNRVDRHLIANGSKDVFAHLHALGFNAVALVPFAGMRGDAIVRFDRHPNGETDLSMRLGAARARAAGMRVLLKPHVWAFGSGDATKIEPASWPAWFASYESYVLHEALLARAIGADWLSVGTELTRSESRPEWHRLIAKVRAVYHGRITYAANFDAFERTPFWRELDAVGVDAYFPLAATPDASDAQLRAGAAAAVARLERVAKANGKPVLLTELGYPSIRTAFVEPWRELRDAPPDAKAQARAFEAMLGAVCGMDDLAGFFVWKYESDPAFTDERGYLPKMPSEGVLRHVSCSK
jgi:hypothetical protein